MVVSMALLDASFYFLAIVSFIMAYFNGDVLWVCYTNSLILFFMMAVIVWAIPLNLNWSRNLYGYLLKKIIFYMIFSISIYALEFWKIGIKDSTDIVYSLRDSIYFSITTWTTLGYGDFSPIPEGRILTSLEALTGLLSIPITASMIWLYCQQRMRESSGDDKSMNDLIISPDEITGLWKEKESDKTIQEKNQRDTKFPLNSCYKCGNKNVKIDKYYSIYDFITPQLKYVAHCTCGNQSKVFITAYQVFWSWNRKNS